MPLRAGPKPALLSEADIPLEPDFPIGREKGPNSECPVSSMLQVMSANLAWEVVLGRGHWGLIGAATALDVH